MQITVQQNLPACRDYLKTNKEETRAPLDDVLIGVTNFFRDRESFDALEREVIPEIMHARRHDDRINPRRFGAS